MASFTFEAITRSGDRKTGAMEAENREAVEQRLKSQGLTAKKVRKKAEPIIIKMPWSTGIETKDLVIFTRQFATMIDAGLPLVQCLDILGSQEPNIFLKRVIIDVKTQVEGGATFADSLGRHPKVFDQLYVNLVRAGEVGGILDTILNRMAAYLEKNAKLVKKVKGAMVYPISIFSVAIGVTVLLLWKVVPTFQKMFTDFGGTLPTPTQVVIDLSTMVQNNILFIFAGIIGFIVGVTTFKNNPKGRQYWDRMLLKLPAVGELLRKVAVARFTRTMATMLSSGVPILDALMIVSRTAGNYVVETALLYVREKISEGNTIVDPLAQTGIFPAMVVQMIGVGESTGAMDTMLSKIADFYDDEVDSAVDALTTVLESVVMVFVGIVVGGFIVSMYLPIFSMAGAIK